MTENEIKFLKVCKVDELKEKIGRKFFIDDVEIAIFKVDGNIYALNNFCAHQHAAIIYDGFIEDGFVVCPAHGWKFALKDGKMKTGTKGLDSYEIKIEDGFVFIKVVKKEMNW